MKNRIIWLVIGVLIFALFSCTGAHLAVNWADPLQNENAFPAKVALFIDASYLLMTPQQMPYLSVQNSIELAGVVNDQAETALTGAKLDVRLQEKYFIASYMNKQYPIANAEGAPVYKKQTPIHMDPTVCRTAKMNKVFAKLWLAAADVIKKAPGNLGGAYLPKSLLHHIAGKYEVDTVAMMVAVSRKDQDATSSSMEPDPGIVLGMHGGSAIFVILVRAIDGKVVYYGSSTIQGPQREATIRSAVAAAFNELPRRVAQQPYTVPPRQHRQQDEGYEFIEEPDTHWLPPPRSTPNQPEESIINAPIATVIGSDEVLLLPRPMGLSTPIARVKPGTRVRVLARELKWYYVQLPDGQRGWIYSKWLRF